MCQFHLFLLLYLLFVSLFLFRVAPILIFLIEELFMYKFMMLYLFLSLALVQCIVLQFHTYLLYEMSGFRIVLFFSSQILGIFIVISILLVSSLMSGVREHMF